ncbi:MAG: nucleotidyltransferase domain-containing protein [Candidatus Latescibacterota bacterium]
MSGGASTNDRRRLLEAELSRCLALLVERYPPQKVLLFGSMVGGDPGEWSDLDLVIIKETDSRFLDRTKEVMRLLRPRVGVDILVNTPSEWADLHRTRAFLRHEVAGRGRLLHESRE